MNLSLQRHTEKPTDPMHISESEMDNRWNVRQDIKRQIEEEGKRIIDKLRPDEKVEAFKRLWHIIGRPNL